MSEELEDQETIDGDPPEEDDDDGVVVATSGLCKQHIRMWPREVIFDGTVEEGTQKIAMSLDILKRPGVYVLYRDDIPYYIGQAKKLRSRLWQHAWNPNSRHFNFWNFFSAFVVEDQGHMNDIEAILIAAMPTANSARPRIEKKKIPQDVVRIIRKLRASKASLPKI